MSYIFDPRDSYADIVGLFLKILFNNQIFFSIPVIFLVALIFSSTMAKRKPPSY